MYSPYYGGECAPPVDKKTKTQKKTENLRKQYYKLCDMRSFLQLKNDMLYVRGDIKRLQKSLRQNSKKKLNEGSMGKRRLIRKLRGSGGNITNISSKLHFKRLDSLKRQRGFLGIRKPKAGEELKRLLQNSKKKLNEGSGFNMFNAGVGYKLAKSKENKEKQKRIRGVSPKKERKALGKREDRSNETVMGRASREWKLKSSLGAFQKRYKK